MHMSKYDNNIISKMDLAAFYVYLLRRCEGIVSLLAHSTPVSVKADIVKGKQYETYRTNGIVGSNVRMLALFASERHTV